MSGEEQLRAVLTEMLEKLKPAQSFEDRIAEAKTPSELEAIMAEYDASQAQPAEEPEEADKIETLAAYEKRADAYNKGLEELETPDQIAAYVLENLAEVSELAQANTRLASERGEEVIDQINQADSVEGIQKALGEDQPQTHEEWLASRTRETE